MPASAHSGRLLTTHCPLSLIPLQRIQIISSTRCKFPPVWSSCVKTITFLPMLVDTFQISIPLAFPMSLLDFNCSSIGTSRLHRGRMPRLLLSPSRLPIIHGYQKNASLHKPRSLAFLPKRSTSLAFPHWEDSPSPVSTTLLPFCETPVTTKPHLSLSIDGSFTAPLSWSMLWLTLIVHSALGSVFFLDWTEL